MLKRIRLLAVLLSLPVLTTALANLWWVFELTCHLRPAYFFGSALIALVLLILKSPQWAIATGVLAVLHFLPLYPAYGPLPDGEPAQTGHPVRLMTANLFRSQADVDSLARQILDHSVDLVLLIENQQAWSENLVSKLNQHDARYELLLTSGHGVESLGLVSRIPVKDARVEPWPGKRDLLRGEIRIGDKWVEFLGVHPYPILTPEFHANRDQQLDAIIRYASSQQDLIILGDLNDSPWGPKFAGLLDAGMIDSRQGRGLQLNYPSPWWLWPVRTTIDHCLVKGAPMVTDRFVGDQIGSDHLPVVVELAPRQAVK